MKYSDIIKEIKEPRQLFLKVLHRYPETFKWMDDETYLKFVYGIALGKKLNLNNPKTFNEKLQWLKLHDRKDIYTTMVDKYEAKKYVAERIGEEHIIPTLGVWNHFDEIDFDALPDQFVLKCTHDSGGLVICTDKSKFDREAARKKIEHSLKRNFYWFGREWPYKNVPARIIAEKYMSEDENNTESSVLTDYKFFCFDGIPRIVYVSKDKADDPRTDFFDMDFRRLPIKMKDPNSNPDMIPQKPERFEEMKEYAAELAKGIKHLRVDFYQIDGEIYVGEQTFYHCSGFAEVRPEEWDLKLGEWIKLPTGGGNRLKSDDCSVIISDFCSNNKEKKALVDYKFFCFNGKVKCLYVSDTEKHLLRFYDADYNPLDIKRDDYKDFDTSPRKPIMFEQMKLLAEKLSSNIPHVRVDFYEINGNIYFGEMTFYTGSGFIPFKEKEWDLTLGELIVLPH